MTGIIDTIPRLIYRLSTIAIEPIHYNGEIIGEGVKTVVIAPGFFRRFSCPNSCGACCQISRGLPVSIDYPDIEKYQALLSTPEFTNRLVYVNQDQYRLISCTESHSMSHCRFWLPQSSSGGSGCRLWEHAYPPEECMSAPQISLSPRDGGVTWLMKRPFGRAWKYLPTAECEFESDDSFGYLFDDIKRLELLEEWADYFHVTTVLKGIINILRMTERLKSRPAITRFQAKELV